MRCDIKDCRNRAAWEHPVYDNGECLGVIHTCKEHKHCADCVSLDTKHGVNVDIQADS